MSRSDYLFHGGDLGGTIQSHGQKLRSQINKLSPGQLLPEDDARVCEHFVADFTISPIELHEEALELVEPREVEKEVRSDFGENYRRCVLEFRFEVPFIGDVELFRLQPSTYSLNPPRAEIANNRLIVTMFRYDRNASAIQQELQATLASVRQHLEWQRQQIDGWNDSLPALVSQLVAARRAKVMADQQLVTELPFRVRRRGEAASYDFPVHRKVVTPPLPAAKAGPLAKPEPALEMAVYEDILQTLAGMSVTMERCPSAFVSLDEESLRMQFLIPLNSKFSGKTSGETFNAAGKTDILIKHDDRILFIAECKFWKGAQSLSDAIDQLLGYLTWRETKGAILLFNRNRDFSAVLVQVPKVIQAHPQFVRTERYDKSTGFRFIVRHPNDAARHLVVTILAFDVPRPA